MVRTGRIKHPIEWEHCGFYELMQDRERYNIILIEPLLDLLGYGTLEQLWVAREEQIHNALLENNLAREPMWTENRIIGALDESSFDRG